MSRRSSIAGPRAASAAAVVGLLGLVGLGGASCEDRHAIVLLLGPGSDTLTSGFSCRQSAGANDTVFKAALQGSDVLFSVVVDVIDLGDRLPTCQPEDLQLDCEGGACMIEGLDRTCVPVSVHLGSDIAVEVRDAIDQAVAARARAFDATHRPALFRVAATLEHCGPEMALDLDGSSALGCAYSCPVYLDEADGDIEVGLDVLSRIGAKCVDAVEACTTFPNVMSPD